jgi:hypothetical protein
MRRWRNSKSPTSSMGHRGTRVSRPARRQRKSTPSSPGLVAPSFWGAAAAPRGYASRPRPSRQLSSARRSRRTSSSSPGALSSVAKIASFSSRVRATILARNTRACSSRLPSGLSRIAASSRTSRSSTETPPSNMPQSFQQPQSGCCCPSRLFAKRAARATFCVSRVRWRGTTVLLEARAIGGVARQSSSRACVVRSAVRTPARSSSRCRGSPNPELPRPPACRQYGQGCGEGSEPPWRTFPSPPLG